MSVLPNQRKRNRPTDWEDLEPSPVLHIRGLPEHTLEMDLIKLFDVYGEVREVTMMPQKRQALVEFKNLSDAEKVVEKSSESPLTIGHNQIQVSFSTSKRIVQRAADKDSSEQSDESMENNVLLFTIYNAQYPITVEIIHQITSPYGTVVRIVMFRKTQVQAMVELKSIDDARNAKRNLNGADIYSGCCTLKVDYARPTRLTVSRNDQDAWDYEKPTYTSWNEGGTNNSFGPPGSLLGHFNENSYRGRSSYDGGPYGGASQAGYQYNRCLMNAPYQQYEGSLGPQSTTPVVMVYNMDMNKMNCDRVFNLLCLYGNVIRVKFLRSNEGSAMVQLGDPMSADRAIENLSGFALMANQLLIRPSKQTMIMDVPQPYELPDGSPSFKDFSNSRNNRYNTPQMASKNRHFRPSRALHYWNCPPKFEFEDMTKIFTDSDAPAPSKMLPYSKTTGRTSSGVLQWETETDALAALAICNHHEIPNPDGPYPYVFKLAFANSTIREQDDHKDADISETKMNSVAVA
jgi:heterogeneous nuclear ribonucleoprotein L